LESYYCILRWINESGSLFSLQNFLSKYPEEFHPWAIYEHNRKLIKDGHPQTYFAILEYNWYAVIHQSACDFEQRDWGSHSTSGNIEGWWSTSGTRSRRSSCFIAAVHTVA
jgi:hypothetical protein